MPKTERLNKPPKLSVDPGLLFGDLSTTRFESIDSLAASKQNKDTYRSSSFFFGQETSGLQNSSQLKVDFSKFENHTFFNSAVVNVNVAFDKIINYYPFDGTKNETINYFENLSGYEKWLFDNRWPKHVGYLVFDPDKQEYIKASDYVGSSPDIISSKKTGKSIVDPNGDVFAIEVHLLPASGTTNQTIFQKKNNTIDSGIVLAITGGSVVPSDATLYFKVANSQKNAQNDYENVSASIECPITLYQWSHVYAEWDRSNEGQYLSLYVNNVLKKQSQTFYVNSMSLGGIDIIVGSGSSWIDGANVSGYFSGSMDELRVWGTKRSRQEIQQYYNKNIFAQEGLLLNYKFNEPDGTGKESLVLDYSGNSLHGKFLSANNSTLDYADIRIASSGTSLLISSSMVNEDAYYCPALFPAYGNVVELNTEMVNSASLYDKSNPAIITSLVPEHYFNQASYFELGAENSDSYGTDIYDTERFNRKSNVGAHILAGLLYTWAKHFDELKIFIDQFGNVLSFGIDDYDQSPNIFARKVADFYGVNLVDFFGDASFRQFFDGESVVLDESWVTTTLNTIRDQIWERIFHALPHVLKSKGTINSIKSYIRAFGIDPDTNFRFVEYGGGSKTVMLSDNRQNKHEVAGMLDMSSSHCRIESPYLSSSHYDSSNNGLLTSQSFAIEQIVKWPVGKVTAPTQSLARLMVTGSQCGDGILFNLVAMSASTDANVSSSVKLFARPCADHAAISAPYLELLLAGVNVYDGDKWNIAWGRDVIPYPSHSYYLMAGKNNFGDLSAIYYTSSLFYEVSPSVAVPSTEELYIALQNIRWTHNASGSYLVIGSQSLSPQTVAMFLNDATDVTDANARNTEFDGQVSQIRFWSKPITINEFSDHIKSFKSLGVEDPINNFNFSASYYKNNIQSANPLTPDWGRLRLDVSCDQSYISSSAAGSITLYDYSQNLYPVSASSILRHTDNVYTWQTAYMSGSGFVPSVPVIKNNDFFFSHISPYWDEPVNNERVHINSLKNESLRDNYTSQEPPIYNRDNYDDLVVDNRFSVEFSIINALNEDIINIFSTLSSLNEHLGGMNNMFSGEYQKLETLRTIYFNRLSDKINIRGFFDFFCWFDKNIMEFAKQLIPAKTKFMGNNFVIEGHMLERSRHEYKFYGQYMNKKQASVGEKESGKAKPSLPSNFFANLKGC